jgi:hypothetical protein
VIGYANRILNEGGIFICVENKVSPAKTGDENVYITDSANQSVMNEDFFVIFPSWD